MKARAAIFCLLAATLLAGRGLAQAAAAKPDASAQKPPAADVTEWVDQGNLWKPGDNKPGMGGPGGPDYARRQAEILKRFDRNGDGKLDDAERAGMEKALQQMQQNGGAARVRAQIIRMFDKDGDGVLNAAEQAEADKFRAAQVKRFDKDGDGRLNDEEHAAALKAFVAEHPDMAPK